MPKGNKVLSFVQGADFYFAKYRRSLEKERYIDALCALRTAYEKEPECQEYALELAELYTEMDFYEESNYILLQIFPTDPQYQEECLYGMGCNFFGMQDITKARECFLKIMRYYPNGVYEEDAEEFLEYLDDVMDETQTLSTEAVAEAEKGRRCLDNGEFTKAIDIFEQLTKKYPEHVFLKNNLALAYYCAGQPVRAIELSRQVLALDRYSPNAICNLLLFAIGSKDNSSIQTYRPLLEKADCGDADDDIKVALTYCELGEEEKAYMLFRRALEDSPYDYQGLYFAAACANNLGRLSEAQQYFTDILKLWPQNTIASYYNRQISDCRKMGEKRRISYNCQVPEKEISRRLAYLNECFSLPDEELRALWKRDSQFSALILWGMEAGGLAARQMIISVLARIQDKKAEEILRKWLLKREESDETKNMLFFALHYAGAKQPYIAYVGGKMTEVRLGETNALQGSIPNSYDEILNLLIDLLKRLNCKNILPNAVSIFSRYLKTCKKPPVLRNTKAWAGALAAMVMQEQKQEIQSIQQIAEILDIDRQSICRCMRLMKKKIVEKV